MKKTKPTKRTAYVTCLFNRLLNQFKSINAQIYNFHFSKNFVSFFEFLAKFVGSPSSSVFFRFSWFMKSSFEIVLKIMKLQKYTQTITEIPSNDYKNTPKRLQKGLQKYTQTITEIHPKNYRNTSKDLRNTHKTWGRQYISS
ncbi:uncharacterized protein DS421_16g558930 [Arachis hypogaea]|nr:uncharacterized protein DS421_16g558930 [Arachis hypogaea]